MTEKLTCSMCTDVIDDLDFGVVIRNSLSDHVLCKDCFKEELK